MKKIILFVATLFAACASGNKKEVQQFEVGEDIEVSVKSSAKEFALQLDGMPEVSATKYADAGTFAVSFSAVTAGTHTLECVDGDLKRLVVCQSVKINGFEKCTYDASKLKLLFATPVTSDDQGCKSKYWIFTGTHRAGLFESLNPILTQDAVNQIIAAKLELITVDVECQAAADCLDFKNQLQRAGVKVLAYINPAECPSDEFSLWMYDSRPTLKGLCTNLNGAMADWKMTGRDGKPLYTWDEIEPSSGKRVTLRAMNLTSTSKVVGGKTWGQYYADYWKRFMVGIFDGVQFDNAKAYCSGNANMILRDANGIELNKWQMDDSCRQGYRDMLTYARTTYGPNFIISARSNSYYFADLLDLVVFEAPKKADLGGFDVKYHPRALVDQFLRMAKKHRAIVYADCVMDCAKSSYLGDGLKSGYTMTLLAPNALHAYDCRGPSGHGRVCENGMEISGLYQSDIYTATGTPVSDEPQTFEQVFAAGPVVLSEGGQVIDIPIEQGSNLRFSYRNDGTFGKSFLRFPSFVDDSAVVNGLAPWIDGTVFFWNMPAGTFKISFSGPGTTTITDIGFLGMDPMCTIYQYATDCYNPDQVDAHIAQGVTILPTEGAIIR